MLYHGQLLSEPLESHLRLFGKSSPIAQVNRLAELLLQFVIQQYLGRIGSRQSELYLHGGLCCWIQEEVLSLIHI